jgi:hypothetical protein
MSPGFGTSARKCENGFVSRRNCFIAASATKQSWQKCEMFQWAECSLGFPSWKPAPIRLWGWPLRHGEAAGGFVNA